MIVRVFAPSFASVVTATERPETAVGKGRHRVETVFPRPDHVGSGPKMTCWFSRAERWLTFLNTSGLMYSQDERFCISSGVAQG